MVRVLTPAAEACGAGFKVHSANHYTIEPRLQWSDEDGIRTQAGRAQWISCPSP